MSQENVNKNYKRPHKEAFTLAEYVDAINMGNVMMLSKAITMIESEQPNHQQLANQLIEKLTIPNDQTPRSIRIGITGVPGVGKSTFIESFGNYLAEQGKKVAVLAVDPSSQKSGGSILGDKTRMETLVLHDAVFIRPSPSKGSLGGVAKATRESIILCEAAGYDVILIETVGVGQSEIAVRGMVDFFLLLMLAGAGDELQGIKRGIMEMADALVITKADGQNVNAAKRAKGEYKNALHLFPMADSHWTPQVEICSALTNFNIEKVWEIVVSYQNATLLNGFYIKNRQQQAAYWLHERILELLKKEFYSNPSIANKLKELEQSVIAGVKSPFNAAQELIDLHHQ
jgi:LAO/AO transport system kinase